MVVLGCGGTGSAAHWESRPAWQESSPRQPALSRRDRGAGEGAERIRFTSSILPRWAQRTQSRDALLPILDLRGSSMGDFQGALSALLGRDAPNLSPSVTARPRGEWEADYARWQRRDLSGPALSVCLGRRSDSAADAPAKAIWSDDGTRVSSSRVAAPYKRADGRTRLLIDAAFDDRLLLVIRDRRADRVVGDDPTTGLAVLTGFALLSRKSRRTNDVACGKAAAGTKAKAGPQS